MQTVKLAKRIFIYILRGLMYTILGYVSALPFLLFLEIPIWSYVLIGLFLTYFVGVGLMFFFLVVTGGYTFASFVFSVKIVGLEEKRITPKQALIRSINENIIILAIMDLFYLIRNKTERSVIDRLSDTFAIDLTH